MIEWLRQNQPLTTTIHRFTLECTCRKHDPFCLNGVTATYRTLEGIVACVRFVAQASGRFRHVSQELYYWTTGMLRHGEASIVASVIEQVPEAREDIGRALQASWITIAHLQLYCAAVKYGCVSLDDKMTDWLLHTRITQPWPEKQRASNETFKDAIALRELGRIALYFDRKAECSVLPKYVQWRIVKEVLWLTVQGENRPALPREIVSLILKGLHCDFTLKL